MQFVPQLSNLPVLDVRAGLEKNGGVPQLYEGQVVSFSKNTVDRLTREIFQTLVRGKVKDVVELLKQLGRASVIVEAIALAYTADNTIDRLVSNKGESIDEIRQAAYDLDPLWAAVMTLKHEVQLRFELAREEEPAWYSIVHQTMEFSAQFQKNPIAFTQQPYGYDLDANDNYRVYRVQQAADAPGDAAIGGAGAPAPAGGSAQSAAKRPAQELEKWLERSRILNAQAAVPQVQNYYPILQPVQVAVPQVAPAPLTVPASTTQTIVIPPKVPGQAPMTVTKTINFSPVKLPPSVQAAPVVSGATSLYVPPPPPPAPKVVPGSAPYNPLRLSSDAYQLPTILEKSESDDIFTSFNAPRSKAYAWDAIGADNNIGQTQTISNQFAPLNLSPSKDLS